MPGVDLYNEAGSLLQGAVKARQADDELALERSKLMDARDTRMINAISGGFTEGAKQYGENKRNAATNAAALEKEKMQQAGETQRTQSQVDAQFITITPQLAKGAIGATGDNGFNDLIGQKMRADVWSGLLTASINTSKLNQPQTLDIQEGDQVYTAEYDPKTRQLRKLTEGGNKFSPDQRDGKTGSGAKLNPFTLQNIVKADEKTLLAQLGNKGAKGIPEQSGLDKLMSKVTNGAIGELDDKEQAKLATLQSLATRLKNNYTNLANLETERGLQPTQVDPQVMDVIDKLLQPQQPKPEGAAGTKVKVINPQGVVGFIPADKLQEKLKLGYKLAPKQ